MRVSSEARGQSSTLGESMPRPLYGKSATKSLEADVRPTFLEFFAGGGLVRAGLGAKWRCLFANDFDPRKAESYVRNWGAGEIKVADVRDLTPGD